MHRRICRTHQILMLCNSVTKFSIKIIYTTKTCAVHVILIAKLLHATIVSGAEQTCDKKFNLE